MAAKGNVYAVILAGGSGTRFWPKSRRRLPKQLCKIGNSEKTMLEITLDRLDGFIPPENRLIVTHVDQWELTSQLVGDRVARIVSEPEARQTAAALTFGTLAVNELHEQSVKDKSFTGEAPVMISLHADHVIRDVEGFRAALSEAVSVASSQDKLCLVGIKPTRPDTGFGYIEIGAPLKDTQSYCVESFREKPDLRTAKEFLAKGTFLWNAGLFVWKTDVILDELRRFLPATYEVFEDIKSRHGSVLQASSQDLSTHYRKLQKIAIDHAVLEVSDHVAVTQADIGWQDVGTWSALDEAFKADENGNLVFTDATLIDCRNTTVDGNGPYVAALGLHDLVVVAMNDAVLVAPKERSQEVKLFVESLKEEGRETLY